MFASSGLPDAAEVALLEPYRARLPEAVFNRVFSFPRSDGIGVDRQGLWRARQLLADAGYKVRGNVLVDTAGEPFTIELLCVSPSDVRILLPYVHALIALGIQANIRLVERQAHQSAAQW